MVTRRGGNKLTSVWMNNVMKLNPNENVDTQNTWIGLYRLVSRSNDINQSKYFVCLHFHWDLI